MKAWTLTFQIRDMVERECPDLKPGIALKIHEVIEKHEKENANDYKEAKAQTEDISQNRENQAIAS